MSGIEIIKVQRVDEEKLCLVDITTGEETPLDECLGEKT